MELLKNSDKIGVPPSLKQVFEACESIYQDALVSGEAFCPYESLRVETIKNKRIALGFPAGSNTTIVNGKKLWLERNLHRIENPDASAAQSTDPMLSIVQKIRADLEHEAKQKIAAAEIAWNDEKACLVLEAESLSSELETLKNNHQATLDALKCDREQIENIQKKYDKQLLEISFSKGEQARLQKTNDEFKAQIDSLYSEHEKHKRDSDNVHRNLVILSNENEASRQAALNQQLEKLTQHFEAEAKCYIEQIRDKDEALMQQAVEIGNLQLANERLETTHQSDEKLAETLNKENKELLRSNARLEGEVATFKNLMQTLKEELIIANSDKAVLEARLKSLEIKLEIAEHD